MVRFSKQFEIQAAPKLIWNVMRDVETWSEWTSTITSINKIGTTDFKVGTKLLIRQPKLPEAVWRIYEMEAEKGFSMSKGNLFLKIVARHILKATANGTSVTLSLEFSGIFGKWVAKKYQLMMEEYLAIEAAGLKRECEGLKI